MKRRRRTHGKRGPAAAHDAPPTAEALNDKGAPVHVGGPSFGAERRPRLGRVGEYEPRPLRQPGRASETQKWTEGRRFLPLVRRFEAS